MIYGFKHDHFPEVFLTTKRYVHKVHMINIVNNYIGVVNPRVVVGGLSPCMVVNQLCCQKAFIPQRCSNTNQTCGIL